MNLLIFEDGSHDNFYPVSQTRPMWDLRVGAFTMLERIKLVAEKSFGSDLRFFFRSRESINELCIDNGLDINECLLTEDILIVNSLLAAHNFNLEKNTVYLKGSRVAAALITSDIAVRIGVNLPSFDFNTLADSKDLKHVESSAEWFLPSYTWDLILSNGDMIRRDFRLLDYSRSQTKKYNVTFIGNESQIYMDEGTRIDPFVCIDVSKGPVIISKNCEINSFTRIEGPCAIGEGTFLLGAKVREGSSFGPVCRIGGEVEDSIFQSYSNKYHDGFIGHSYIGEWVNLGALTTNSDLKNDYTNVRCKLPSGYVDTGSKKVGCIIGDFVKTSIGTLMNTGSVIGTGAMLVFSGRMTPPRVPDFCRFIKNELRDPGRIDEIIATNRISSSRRGKAVHPSAEKLLNELYSNSKKEREAEIAEWNAALK